MWLDEKIDNEERAWRREHLKKESQRVVSELKDGVVQKVGEFADGVVSKVKAYIEDAKDDKVFQKQCKKEFDEYISMHEETRYGAMDSERLDNGGIRITIFTDNGAIIKTIEHIDPTRTDDIPSRHIDKEFYHARPDKRVTYEGYCYWCDESSSQKHYYFAKLSRTIQERVKSGRNGGKDVYETFDGYERLLGGKFRKIYQVTTNSCPIEVYEDLRRTFEEAYYRIKSKKSLNPVDQEMVEY